MPDHGCYLVLLLCTTTTTTTTTTIVSDARSLMLPTKTELSSNALLHSIHQSTMSCSISISHDNYYNCFHGGTPLLMTPAHMCTLWCGQGSLLFSKMKLKDLLKTFRDLKINFQGLSPMLLMSMSFNQSMHLTLSTSFVQLIQCAYS